MHVRFSRKPSFRASLGTTFSHGISIFPKENELISLGKMEFPWENVFPKLALKLNAAAVFHTTRGIPFRASL
jgi:hypothetical protein